MNPLSYKKWGFCSILMTLFIFKSFGQFDRPQKANTQTGNNNTQFIKPLEAGIYFIKIKNTGKYWGVEGINPNNGAKVVQWDFVDQANHKFQVDKTADGFYTIKALHSGRYLNVAGQSVQDGAPIVQWDFVNQDNMKFTILSINGGWVIRGKQSNKDVKLSGNINNAANGTPLIINGNAQAGTQVFTFEKTSGNPPLSTKPPSTTYDNKIVATKISFRLPDGTTVNRTIGGTPTMRQGNPKKVDEKVINADHTCTEKVAKIDMGEQESVPVSSSDYKLNNAPGLMYDISAFYGSDYRNRLLLPYGEKRQPITLVASVRNMQGSISEVVQTPTLTTVNDAISRLYRRFTSNPEKISAESMVYKASSLESSSEFFMKIGASAHYMGGSVNASMSITNKSEYKYLYFEGTKVMFSIQAERGQQGFFNENMTNTSSMGYISRATYGVKVIGKVEIKNTMSGMSGEVQAAYNAGFAGGSVSLSALQTDISKESKVFLYVVGGTSNTVATCTVQNIQETIDNILRNVNYHTSEPISLTFSDLNGNPMKYKDLTNDFPFKQCAPNTGRDISISVNSMKAIGDDCDLFGDIWVELVRPNENLARYRQRNANRIFQLGENQYVKTQDLMTGQYKPNIKVNFNDIPFNQLQGSELHVYYMLKDYDKIDTDLLEQRNGHKVRIPNTNWDFYRSEISLDLSTTQQEYETDFVYEGDGVKIKILIESKPK